MPHDSRGSVIRVGDLVESVFSHVRGRVVLVSSQDCSVVMESGDHSVWWAEARRLRKL